MTSDQFSFTAHFPFVTTRLNMPLPDQVGTARTIGSLDLSAKPKDVVEAGVKGRRSFCSKKDQRLRERKIVRILTVIAYVISVSTVSVLLIGYYVFIWTPQPSEPLIMRRTTPLPQHLQGFQATHNRHLTHYKGQPTGQYPPGGKVKKNLYGILPP